MALVVDEESPKRVTLSFQFCNNSKGKQRGPLVNSSSCSVQLWGFFSQIPDIFIDPIQSSRPLPAPPYTKHIDYYAPLASFQPFDNLVFDFDVVQMRNVKRPQFVRTRG